MKHLFAVLLLGLLISACTETPEAIEQEPVDSSYPVRDSFELAVIDKVNEIISMDSLLMIPSLRYSSGENETYTVKQYFSEESTRLISVESYTSTTYKGSNIYYSGGHPVFVNEVVSVFEPGSESYLEKIVFLDGIDVHSAYAKTDFNEMPTFEDTLFTKTELEASSIDFEKPIRALQQKGEFEMYFDEFLLIEPQSYLIVESKDGSTNSAIFIKQSDELLDKMYESPKAYEGKRIWVNHYFEEMNGIERMIYNGAELISDQ